VRHPKGQKAKAKDDNLNTGCRQNEGKRKVSDAASDNCAECGRIDSPKKGRCKGNSDARIVNWTQCDLCAFW